MQAVQILGLRHAVECKPRTWAGYMGLEGTRLTDWPARPPDIGMGECQVPLRRLLRIRPQCKFGCVAYRSPRVIWEIWGAGIGQPLWYLLHQVILVLLFARIEGESYA